MKVRKNSTSKTPMWDRSWRTAIAIAEKEKTAPLIHRQPRTTGETGTIPNGTVMGSLPRRFFETEKTMKRKTAKRAPEQRLDIFPHSFPRDFFERMKEIAGRNPSLAAALKR